MDEVLCVSPVGDICGEGLVWSEPQGALFWTDINRFLVHRHVPGSSATDTWQFDEPVVALGLTAEPDRLLVALASRLVLWSTTTDDRREHGFVLRDTPRLRLNDGRVGPRGEFIVGSMKNNVEADGTPGTPSAGQGTLYSIHGSKVRELESGIGIPNTICWSPDKRVFYFADTLKNEIRAYDYDPDTGEIANPRPFFAGFERGLPDGSAVDSDGFLWNCRYGGACLVRIAPNGVVDRVVEMPVDNPTTCAFGGTDQGNLFVTSAASTNHFQRLSGSLFQMKAPVRGLGEFNLAA
ncbi:SMP-30/gluconolactonase/LRE family protein [Shinella sp.]|uniref:SMP-30/gluconolactonase/LRE family protein n=1 Tax=Shinella sp. TaxID=1870904 RepID=UPI0025846A12|nr:SMP-30/gluconolactonase/LRE family protein [Shinella sp.]MCW5706880.1 SMP-30/gluconolactonase/LRE family protein [Shinella sp.]